MSLVRRAAWSLRHEGFGPLVRRSGSFLRDASQVPRAYASIVRARKAPPSLEKDLDFVFDGCDGVIRPMQVRSEIRTMHERLEALAPRRSMEIGTARGGTLFLLARRTRSPGTIVSVDLHGGEFGGGYAEWRIPLYQAFARRGQRIGLLRGDSHSAGMRAAVERRLDGPLDFLFIDGDHTYEGVKRDFDLYSPLVRKGGLVGFHDIAVHVDPKTHVHEFWNEVKASYKSEEIVENPAQGWGGIGLLTT